MLTPRVSETPRPRVLVTIPVDHLPRVKTLLDTNVNVTYLEFPSKMQLLELIGEYEAVIPNLALRLDADILEAAGRLKLIATPSTGTDHVDIAAADTMGIVLQSLKTDYDVLKHITSTAEHAFLLMLSIVRRLPFAFDSVRAGSWESAAFRGRELQGRALGILGYGRLGEIVSRYAHAFEMEVLAHDPNVVIGDDWVTQIEFDDLFRRSEIVTLHVHLTEQTKGLVGERELGLMPDGAYLVNTSRGAVIDERSLIAALLDGKLAGAAVDVLDGELDGPVDGHPLVEYSRTHQNLIITPHIGGRTTDAQEKAFTHTVRKMLAFLQGTKCECRK